MGRHKNSTTQILHEMDLCDQLQVLRERYHRALQHYSHGRPGDLVAEASPIHDILQDLSDLIYKPSITEDEKQDISQQLQDANRRITELEKKANVASTNTTTAAAATENNTTRTRAHSSLETSGITRKRAKTSGTHKNIGIKRKNGITLKSATTCSIDDLKKDLETARREKATPRRRR